MTLSELREYLKHAEAKLNQEQKLLDIQRELATKGLKHMMGFQLKQVAEATMQVGIIQKRINKEEDKERQALYDIQEHLNSKKTENKPSIEDNMAHIIMRLKSQRANFQPIPSIAFQESLTLSMDDIAIALQALKDEELIRFETNVKVIGFYLLWLEIKGLKWLEEYEKKQAMNKHSTNSQPPIINNYYHTGDKVEIKELVNSNIGDVLQSSKKEFEKGSTLSTQIILLIISGIIALATGLIIAYFQHWFGWNK